MNKTNVTTILLPTSMHSFLFSPTAQKVAQPLASNAAVTSSTIRLTHSRYILAEGYTPSHVIKEASVAPFLEIAVISTYPMPLAAAKSLLTLLYASMPVATSAGAAPESGMDSTKMRLASPPVFVSANFRSASKSAPYCSTDLPSIRSLPPICNATTSYSFCSNEPFGAAIRNAAAQPCGFGWSPCALPSRAACRSSVRQPAWATTSTPPMAMPLALNWSANCIGQPSEGSTDSPIVYPSPRARMVRMGACAAASEVAAAAVMAWRVGRRGSGC
mmetsp:Transcript_14719/g.24447  ORF Transcript_14719/g.24447 Transcript_14719/m.24447 type:complete len:274 (+) Transcript_14719:204-1025(+)